MALSEICKDCIKKKGCRFAGYTTGGLTLENCDMKETEEVEDD